MTCDGLCGNTYDDCLTFFVLICRLDLENFVLASPEGTDNTCMNDEFYVTGGSSGLPTICGTNSGQHSKTCTQGKVLKDTIKALH